jgi:VanZ family protein
MAAISLGSTDALAASETSWLVGPFLRWLFPDAAPATLDLLHDVIRKIGHLMEFGLLALLWYRAFAWGETGWSARAAGRSLAVSVLCAAIDEAHQAFESRRVGSLLDVGIDSLGAIGALSVARAVAGRWRRGRTLPRALRDRPGAMGLR